DRALQGFDLLARAQQHRALHVELLAGDQVELAEPRLQHRLEVLLQLLAALAHRGRHKVAEPAGEFVELAEVDHRVGLAVAVMKGRVHGISRVGPPAWAPASGAAIGARGADASENTASVM